MQKLVEQLLFLARGDSGRNNLRIENIQLNELMKEVFEESKMIDAEHEYEYIGEPVKLNGDVSMIKQCARILIDNAEVYAEGDINAGYILNSNMTAIGKIIIDGAKGVIYGGELTGVMGIETPLLGNNSHTITAVRVGPSKKLQTEYANLLIKIKEIDSEISMYENVLRKFDLIKKSAPEKLDRQAYTKVFQSKIIKAAEKAKFQSESKRLFDIIRESGSSGVRIEKAIYPGARVYIDDVVFQPNEEMNHLTVRKVNEKIVVRDYDD